MKPSPKRATLERQGKRKEKRRPTENGTRPAEEGEDRSAWTNLTRRKPTTTSARNGPNLPGGRRTQEHMKKEEKGTHGELVNDMMASTTHAEFVIRLKGPRHSFHNPLDSLRVQPLNYVHNWTSPPTIKRKNHHTCRNVLMPSHGHMSCSKISSSVLSWAKLKKKVVAASVSWASLEKEVLSQQKATSDSQADLQKKWRHTAASSSTLTRPTCETLKEGHLFHFT